MPCVCVCVLQIIDPESWNMLFGRIKALPPSTRHIVMVTTVPVVYPQVRSLLSRTLCEVAANSQVDSPLLFALFNTLSTSGSFTAVVYPKTICRFPSSDVTPAVHPQLKP